MRKIPKSLAIVGLLTPLVAPVNAGALGIGDIRVRSNLNQSLLAEIPLVTSGSDSISDVKINLAPPEAFARAGIERQFFLSKLVFKPVQKPDGTYVIQVSSREPITEPFLNFLVEVNWPQGHLLREFTALLDPPATYEDRVSTTIQTPETSSVPEEPAVPKQEVKPPKARRAQSATPPATRTPPALDSTENGSYGPVKKDETLWSIARNLGRQSKASPEQLMRSLFAANPSAFSRGNANLLKAGATLIVPGIPGELSANNTFAKPTGQSSLPADLKPEPKPLEKEKATETPVGQLKLFSPAESTLQEKSPAPSIEGGTVGQKPGAVSEKPEAPAPSKTDEVTAKLAELEQKLSAMQGLISLKDQQIATLQAGQKQQPETKAEQGKNVKPQVSETDNTGKPTASSQALGTQSVTPQQPQQSTLPITPPKTPEAVAPAHNDKRSETNSSDWIPDSYYLVVGGIGTFLLGALIWVTYRRRAAMLDDFESMFPRDAQESAFSEVYANQNSPELKATPSETGTGSKSSFLVEFSASDFDSLDTESDELDPISEADVYLAYGRYKQAEDLIRHAISQHPDRDECKLKLLEIHYATENKEAFESFARELYSAKRDSDPEFWGKVTEMGRELCPTSALFESGEENALKLGDEELEIIQPATRLRDTQAAISKREDINSYNDHIPDFISNTSNDDDSVNRDFDFSVNAETLTRKIDSEVKSKSSDTEAEGFDPMSLDFDFGLIDEDANQTETNAKSTLSIPGDIVDITDMNELETKLDLAKAFVDMEDVDSAREILEEIAKDGTDAQKEEARSLLSKIE